MVEGLCEIFIDLASCHGERSRTILRSFDFVLLHFARMTKTELCLQRSLQNQSNIFVGAFFERQNLYNKKPGAKNSWFYFYEGVKGHESHLIFCCKIVSYSLKEVNPTKPFDLLLIFSNKLIIQPK